MEAINKYFRYFGFTFVGFFLVLGFLLILSDYFTYIPRNSRIIFGAILILYGAFRLVTLLNKPTQSEGDDKKEEAI
jgi:hypothetical protein